LENYDHLETMPRSMERRKRRDFLSVSLSLFGVVTAVILFTMALCLIEVRSETPESVGRFSLPLQTLWNFTPLRHLFYLFVTGFTFSSIGLAINTKRLKRKHDRVRYNLIFLWILSAVGIGATFLYIFITFLCRILTFAVYSG